MHNQKTYDLTLDRQKTQLRFADNYRMSQSLDEQNKQTFNWRNLLNPLNRN